MLLKLFDYQKIFLNKIIYINPNSRLESLVVYIFVAVIEPQQTSLQVGYIDDKISFEQHVFKQNILFGEYVFVILL